MRDRKYGHPTPNVASWTVVSHICGSCVETLAECGVRFSVTNHELPPCPEVCAGEPAPAGYAVSRSAGRLWAYKAKKKWVWGGRGFYSEIFYGRGAGVVFVAMGVGRGGYQLTLVKRNCSHEIIG